MPRSFYVTTKNIFDENSWSDPVYVDQQGFDPDLFFDQRSGKTYLTSTSGAGQFVQDPGYFSIFKTEIDLKTGDSLVESEVFHVSTLPLDTPRLAEGSHLYDLRKTHGFIYLLTAEAGTDVQHRAMIKRAPSMDGPWEENPNNPILFNGRNMSNPILATGHADFVETPEGKWYVVFLGTRPQNPTNSSGKPQLGRETFLAPMTWDKNGWPVVNQGKDITLEMPGLYNLPRPKKWLDEFNGKFVDKAYYTARTPSKPFWSFSARPGWLRLRGNVYTLDDRETPAAWFRKQVDLSTIVSTELEFSPKNTLQEAGLTVFLSIHYHNDIYLAWNPWGNCISIVSAIRSGANADAVYKYVKDLPADYTGSVKLAIKAEPHQYTLGYALRKKGANGKYGEEFEELQWTGGSVEAKWLQAYKQGWQVFTGTFFGVYATGKTMPLLVPAVSGVPTCSLYSMAGLMLICLFVVRISNTSRRNCYRWVGRSVGSCYRARANDCFVSPGLALLKQADHSTCSK